MNTINPELLMRYADNELSLPECRMIEDELRKNPEAQALVASFLDQRHQLQAALSAGDEEGLQRCELAIDRALERRRRDRRMADIRRWALPIAASLLITLIGGVFSLHYADQKAETEAARVQASHAHDRNLALQMRVEALEQMLSGKTLTWANDVSGAEGAITPLRTFRRSDGQWCREYRETITAPDSKEERLSIACRNNHDDWAPPPVAGAT